MSTLTVLSLSSEFVEFFGKFYEGGGRPFKAFQTANKYVEIKNLNQGDH